MLSLSSGINRIVLPLEQSIPFLFQVSRSEKYKLRNKNIVICVDLSHVFLFYFSKTACPSDLIINCPLLEKINQTNISSETAGVLSCFLLLSQKLDVITEIYLTISGPSPARSPCTSASIYIL